MARRKKGGKAAGARPTRAPSWSGAVNRALVGAGIFLAILLLVFKQPPGSSLALAVFMMAVYVPLGYTIDRFFYNRRQANLRRAREGHGRP
jgi:ABC-type multidrug transport system permease subunit